MDRLDEPSLKAASGISRGLPRTRLGASAAAFAAPLRTYLLSRATRRAAALAIGALLAGLLVDGDMRALGPAAACALLVAVAAPAVVRLGNQWEDRAALATALVSAARLSQLAFQLALGIAVAAVALLVAGLPSGGATGALAAALLFALGSGGWHCLGSLLAYRNFGNRNLNTIAAVAPGASLLALDVTMWPAWSLAFVAYASAGAVVLLALLALAVASDLRSRWYPKRGVGVFFGTFNPFHKTHLAIVRRALEERKLHRVIIHPTTVPKLHAAALQRGEIEIASRESGMRVYRRTTLGDPNVNYFPTGNRFFEHSARRTMIELALREAGLEGKVEVWSLPEVYGERGFHGILEAIRRTFPEAPLHGIHGSDPGGMWVRSIFDQFGWIYPCPVRRIDGVSATAVRLGAKGMVSPAVERVLAAFQAGEPEVSVAGRRYRLCDGEMLCID